MRIFFFFFFFCLFEITRLLILYQTDKKDNHNPNNKDIYIYIYNIHMYIHSHLVQPIRKFAANKETTSWSPRSFSLSLLFISLPVCLFLSSDSALQLKPRRRLLQPDCEALGKVQSGVLPVTLSIELTGVLETSSCITLHRR